MSRVETIPARETLPPLPSVSCADSSPSPKGEGAFGKWISVKDKLPEDGTDVIVCTEGGRVVTLRYYDGFNCTKNYKTGEICKGNEFKDVTHWMPLPEPPKVEWVKKDDVLRMCPRMPDPVEIKGILMETPHLSDYMVGWTDGVKAFKDAVRRMAGEERDA